MSKDTLQNLPQVTRVEVISTGKGRVYVNMDCKYVTNRITKLAL